MITETDEAIERIQSEEEDLDFGTPVYRIRSYPSDPELETLYLRWQREDIIIPTFQRGFVWNISQASRLIESFLMGLPVPGIFVFVQEQGETSDRQKQLVIDGQQRLKSIFGFFEGQFPGGRVFRLAGVDPRWQDKTYSELNPSEKTTLLTSVLRVVNIEQRDLQANDSGIYQIFERLNTGGTVLTPQEIRNSSYRGPFNNMLMETNRDTAWRAVFGRQEPDARMRDVELIARVLALYDRSDTYTKPMKQFISDYMRDFRLDPDPETRQQIFLGSTRRVVAHLGERPFHIRRGINVATFDCVMVAFARETTVPKDIAQRYERLLSNKDFVDLTTTATTDVDTVKARLGLAQRMLF